MLNRYDIAYGIGVGLAAPFWLLKPSARRKVLRAFSQRMGRQLPARDVARPAVMIHAVSLGEMNATRGLVRRLAELRADLDFIVTTTTDTGYARGQDLYGGDPRVTLVRYPLDFTGGVTRLLDALRPELVVLLELEVWPNFLRQCEERRIPVVLVNGRMTPSSFRTYRLVRPVVRPMFRRLAAVCAQEDVYARRFVELGVPPARVTVTGTMKFDTATLAAGVEGDAELAAAVGLRPGPGAVWVCGSTGPGEEEIVLRCYRRLLSRHANLRLVIVPRKPERFDEVADLIRTAGFDLVRRSQPRTLTGQLSRLHGKSILPPVVLGDTMGELRKFYALASVVFVGRTLVDLGHRQHGSDMIEPAALGRAVIFGPWTDNFAEVVNRFREADAIFEVHDEEQLEQAVSVLLSTPAQAAAMGVAAQQVVKANQGATERHVGVILDHFRQHTAAAWPAVLTAEHA